jgi:Rrf2 family protein
MLALTRKSDYALVALSHLARRNGSVSSAREIADIYHVPLPILMNILKTLTRHGMIESVRGAHGGYRLALVPREISLRMVVNAMEGPVRLFPCASSADGAAGACTQENWCPIAGPAKRVSGRLQEFLGGVTLEEIAEEQLHSINAESVGVKKE